MYSYRYKGDPKSYPKVAGPMAEDVMQVAPHAVRTMGVHAPTGQAIHGVDMNALDVPGRSPIKSGDGANPTWPGLRSGRAACRARAARSRRGCLGRSRRRRRWG